MGRIKHIITNVGDRRKANYGVEGNWSFHRLLKAHADHSFVEKTSDGAYQIVGEFVVGYDFCKLGIHYAVEGSFIVVS